MMSGFPIHLAANRREFFKNSGRVVLLTGLAAVAAVAARRAYDDSAPACARPYVCQGCSQFSACDLPKAQEARSQKSGG